MGATPAHQLALRPPLPHVSCLLRAAGSLRSALWRVNREGSFIEAKGEQLRLLPSIDELLHSPTGQHLVEHYSRPLTLRAVRTSIAQARANIRDGALCPSPEELLAAAEHMLEQEQLPNLRPVINATGVIINTNLGRAPLSQQALAAVQMA